MIASALEHRPQLDGVRFFAFFAVFCFHANEIAFPYGKMGVPLFFVLSGFLITRILVLHESGRMGRDLLVFYARRTLRIFPLYYAVLLLMLMGGNLPDAGWYFLYLHNVLIFITNEWTGRTSHFWSLCVEEQFYLLYPLTLLATPARWRGRMLLALLACSTATRLTLNAYFSAPRSYPLLPVSGEYLLWGCLAGLIDLRQARRALPLWTIFVAGVLLHAATAVDQYRFGVLARLGAKEAYQTLHGVGFALAIFALWRMPANWLVRLMSVGGLVYLGRISYGLYVFHNFMLDLKGWLLPYAPFLEAVPGIAMALVATVLLSMLSWHFFEAPINRLKRRARYRSATPESTAVEEVVALPDPPRRSPRIGPLRPSLQWPVEESPGVLTSDTDSRQEFYFRD